MPDFSNLKSTCVVGLQWGDEAKGKIVDLLCENSDFVVRYNGGANAGHTVVKEGKKFKFSLLPSGVLRPHVTSIIGNGLVVHPVKFLEEVQQLKDADIPVGDNLVLSDRAHLIFPYHIEQERLNEEQKGQNLGTTGRGIGPCYQDKVGRITGIRVGELISSQLFREKVRNVVARKNRLLRAFSESPRQFDPDELADEYLRYGEQISPYIKDSARILHQGLQENKTILFEGAQGSLLDIDHGTYPYVTSSNSTAAGIWSGSGVSPRKVGTIIGIIKAYTTRVGQGPFPTELDDGSEGIGERIRRAGNEYGTVTGRPRRCGWLDAVALKYTATLNDVDLLSIMLLDVLAGLPELKICTAYELDGEKIDFFPLDLGLLDRCKPIYETLPGFSEQVTEIKKIYDLPSAARKYLDRISEILDRPVAIVSVGPDREQTMFAD